MAISCSVTCLRCCSPVSSISLRVSYFFARTPTVTLFSKKNDWGIVYCTVPSQLTVSSSRGGHNEVADFCVVNFYKFVSIEDPDGEVAKHQEFLQGLDIHGRIYLNEQGINAQHHLMSVVLSADKLDYVHLCLFCAPLYKSHDYDSSPWIKSRAALGLGFPGNPRAVLEYSGPIEDALAYADWLKEDPRFSDILVQTSPTLDGHAFPRLKMRYKPSLVQLEEGMSHLPVFDATMRATMLTPAEWRERLLATSNSLELPNKASASNQDRRPLLLDVRNGYEWDVGHFQGAERPEVDSFRHTFVGLSSDEATTFDLLAGVDKENTDIIMYCTGGIRCDVYSTVLRQRGFQNLYTLNGGVSHYLKSEGSTGWVGNLFVFDSRLSLPPSTYNSTSSMNVRSELVSESERFAKCYTCKSQVQEFRHRNCANLDCNRLFLCCDRCVEKFRGCCCFGCTKARRLRPVLLGHKRYQKWHLYRDSDS